MNTMEKSAPLNGESSTQSSGSAPNLPILYSFRRCPYAMRARMAVSYAGLKVELREIELKNKPSTMLELSSKGTVPILVLPDGQLIEESLDIMLWALSKNDPEDWRQIEAAANQKESAANMADLIAFNDGEFKYWLDKYKYADRHPEHMPEYYRTQALSFLSRLEELLSQNDFLLGNSISLADIAIMPFIRQFASVDSNWFEQINYPLLQQWLNIFLTSNLFSRIMQKYKPWQTQDAPTVF